jgi:hypothetical protein
LGSGVQIIDAKLRKKLKILDICVDVFCGVAMRYKNKFLRTLNLNKISPPKIVKFKEWMLLELLPGLKGIK